MDERFAPVADAIRAGDKIEAVRQLRIITGMGLSEATTAVEQLESEHAAAERGAPSPSGAIDTSDTIAASIARDFAALRSPRDPGVAPLVGELADEVEAIVRDHRYLDAIKLVQARTGGDLKTVRDQVFLLMDQRGIARRKSSAWALLAFAAFFLAVGLFVLFAFMAG
jgi:hypothetical protein